MTFRHVVMFRWTDDAPADQAERVSARLSELPAVIDEIRSYVHGPDLGISEGNWDYVVVADFDGVADFRTYRDHPEHLRLIDEIIKDNVADRAAVQYERGGH